MPKILIVHDHPLYREGVSATLTRRIPNAEVLGVATVGEGLSMPASMRSARYSTSC